MRAVLKREDVEARFLSLLVEEGVDLERPTTASVAGAWAAMGRFQAEQVEGAVPPEGDWTSAGWGVHEPLTGGVFFELRMTRQLTFYDGDDYAAMMHLYCSFLYEPLPELRALGDRELMFDEPVDPDWQEAMDLSGYQGVRAVGAEPLALSVEFTES